MGADAKKRYLKSKMVNTLKNTETHTHTETSGNISIVFKYENESEMIIFHFSHLLISSDSG